MLCFVLFCFLFYNLILTTVVPCVIEHSNLPVPLWMENATSFHLSLYQAEGSLFVFWVPPSLNSQHQWQDISQHWMKSVWSSQQTLKWSVSCAVNNSNLWTYPLDLPSTHLVRISATCNNTAAILFSLFLHFEPSFGKRIQPLDCPEPLKLNWKFVSTQGFMGHHLTIPLLSL